MEKTFVCSLICPGGILGGGLYLNSEALTYRTNKITVDPRYKWMTLLLKDIESISWKWIIFPIAKVTMKSGDSYSFIIFNKKRFEKCFSEYKKED